MGFRDSMPLYLGSGCVQFETKIELYAPWCFEEFNLADIPMVVAEADTRLQVSVLLSCLLTSHSYSKSPASLG